MSAANAVEPAPSAGGRALVVSLHDVSPRTRGACAEILRELAALGVPRCSLLVIPDIIGAGIFSQTRSARRGCGRRRRRGMSW